MRPVRDVAVPAITLGVMAGAVLARAQEAPAWPSPELAFFTMAAWLPLLVRIRWPVPVLVATVGIEMAHLIVMHDLGAGMDSVHVVGAYQPVPVATMVALYTVIAHRPARTGLVATGVATFALLLTSLLAQSIDLAGTDIVMTELIVTAAGVGFVARGRAERRERQAAQAAAQTRQAVLEERLRIARDLHDTVAHNLALIDAQAGVADHLLDADPEAARKALRGITSHTSAAIDDLRATLLLLRVNEDPAVTTRPSFDQGLLAPTAGLAMVDTLVTRARGAGAMVELSCSPAAGARELSHQADLAAYRIVQEALTNATKYAPGAAITITVEWVDDGVQLSVRNAPGRSVGSPVAGTGHGLIGLRERARNAGGRFAAGPTPEGGYLVDTWLPARIRDTRKGDLR